MSQEIGVDVERMHQLVSALENLRDTLADNVPVIVNTLNEYWSGGTGQPISLLALQQAPAKSHADAAAIWSRTRMAVTYQDQPDARLSDGMVAIPWDMSAKDQAEYEAGAQAARNLDDADQLSKADFENAIAQLAKKAGNPYYAAGYFNSLNAQTLTQLIDVMGILAPGQDTSRIYEDLVAVMADGSLSRGSMNELANLLGMTSTQSITQLENGPNGSGIYVLGEAVPVEEFYAERYQLLEDIAKSPGASANFIASTDPAQIQAILRSFDPNSAPFCRSSAGIKSILQIMTNAVDSERSPQTLTQPPPAGKLVASLGGDLKVLNAETLSQNSTELAAFMKAAANKLAPPVPVPLTVQQFGDWSAALYQNLQAMKPLLESIGTSYQNYQQSVSLQRAFLENVMLGALTALIPVPDGGPIAKIAMGAGEGAGESLPAFQNFINKGMSYLIPDNLEGGAQAAVSAEDQLKEARMISGLISVYEAAGDGAGLQSLLQSPTLWKTVEAVATGGPLPDSVWYDTKTVPLSGYPDFPLNLLLPALANASPQLPAQDLPPS
jgi:hypothetical protein